MRPVFTLDDFNVSDVKRDDFNVSSIKTANVCEKLDDPCLIYKVHNNSLDPSRPSFVFKSSKEQLQIAVDKDRQGSNPLGEEYCHLDGNHKRCAGFKTITLGMYHPFLWQMCKIANMEVESENTLAMNLFCEVLNEALQEYTANKSDSGHMVTWWMRLEPSGLPLQISKEKKIFKGLSAVKNILTLLRWDKRRPLLEVKWKVNLIPL